MKVNRLGSVKDKSSAGLREHDDSERHAPKVFFRSPTRIFGGADDVTSVLFPPFSGFDVWKIQTEGGV
jgi:hypothetical protein